jgi:hypothetical protein
MWSSPRFDHGMARPSRSCAKSATPRQVISLHFPPARLTGLAGRAGGGLGWEGAIMMKDTMLRLRLKNPVPAHLPHHFPFPHLAPNSPWKPCLRPPTQRRFHVVSLPQKDGSYVASVVEAPSILVYDESRKTAEQKASKRFLKTPDPHAYLAHPLARTKTVTIEMEFDEEWLVRYIRQRAPQHVHVRRHRDGGSRKHRGNDPRLYQVDGGQPQKDSSVRREADGSEAASRLG